MSEIHVTLTSKSDTTLLVETITSAVPFLAPTNPNNNFNNENTNRLLTGDQSNTIEVTSSVINEPDNAQGSSSAPPNNTRPGPQPSPTPGPAFITPESTRAPGLVLGQASTGIAFYNGVPNVQPQGEFIDAINKFPPREGP